MTKAKKQAVEPEQVGSVSVKLRTDAYKSMTSTAAGADSDAMAFNIALITKTHPHIASSLIRIYGELPLYEEAQPVEGEAVEQKTIEPAKEEA